MALLQKMALERCRLHVSHICAHHHLLAEDFVIGDVIERLNQEIDLIEKLLDSEKPIS